MWLIILAIAAVISTAAWYFEEKDYELDFLSIILWGATIMVFIDHLMNYLVYGKPFLDTSLNAALLGITLVIIALVAWEAKLIWNDPKGKIAKNKIKDKSKMKI